MYQSPMGTLSIVHLPGLRPRWIQRYTYRVLQTIQMKLCAWAVLGSTKTALKFKYKIQIGYYSIIQFNVWGSL